MIDYLKGVLAELTPTMAVVEVNGVGYAVNITLVTYAELTGAASCKLYVYEAIREDAHLLYGFSTQSERSLFLVAIGVGRWSQHGAYDYVVVVGRRVARSDCNRECVGVEKHKRHRFEDGAAHCGRFARQNGQSGVGCHGTDPAR